MFDLVVMIVFSFLNMVGIILWAITGLMAMDIVWSKTDHELNFRRIFTREICVWFARMKRKLKIDNRYAGSMLVFMGAIIAILVKITELKDVADYTSLKVCGRIITSLFIPWGIIKIYNASGYKCSFFQ